MESGLQDGEKLVRDPVFEFLVAVCAACERPGHCAGACQQQQQATEEENVLDEDIEVLEDLEAYAALLREIEDDHRTKSTRDNDEAGEEEGGVQPSGGDLFSSPF